MSKQQSKALFVYADADTVAKFNHALIIAGESKSTVIRQAIKSYADAVLKLNAKVNFDEAMQYLVTNRSDLKEQTTNVR